METAAALDALLTHEAELEQHATELTAALVHGSEATIKLRRRLRSQVKEGGQIELDQELRGALDEHLVTSLERWNALTTAYAALEAQARTTFEEELPQRRQALYEIAGGTRFQEALWFSSPHLLERGLHSYLAKPNFRTRPARVRRIERQLITYLQRLCAKNDTNSFFGPLNFGDSASEQGTALPGPGMKHIQRRQAYLAHWGVVALAEIISKDPGVQPFLRPHISPLCRLELAHDRAIVAETTTIPLSAVRRELLAQIDGSRTVAAIADALQRPQVNVIQELERLARAFMVVLQIEVSVVDPFPLNWLQLWIAALPPDCTRRDHWAAALHELREMQDRFGPASFDQRRAILAALETRFTALTGLEARRGEGQLYADRLLLHEDALGGMSPLSLGPGWAAELHAQLAPVLDLWAAHGCATHEALQAHSATLLRPLMAQESIPLLQLLRQPGVQDTVFTPPPTSWQEAVTTFVAQHVQQRVIALDDAVLPPVDAAALERWPLITSPDIMVLARDLDGLRAGEFQIVVGECHDTLMIWGWPLYFHPERAAVEAAAQRLIDATRGAERLACIIPARRTKIAPFEYPGLTIEMLVASDRPPEERVPVSQVTATLADGRPTLQTAGQPRIRLYNGEIALPVHSMFALPRVVPFRIDTGTHTPRLTLGKVVVQRERWTMRREDLLPQSYAGTSFELMRAVMRAARRLGLPRYLFARVPDERKPLLIDCHNYFLLEMLHDRLAPGAPLVLHEMLPSPDQLWLRDGQDAFCAELRLSAFHVPEDAAHARS